MTTETIQYETPPNPKGRFRTGEADRLREWLNALAADKDHKGQFAKFPERVNTSTGSHIKSGKLSGVPAGRFDAVTRNTQDGRADLYVRFVGADDTPLSEVEDEIVEAVVHRLAERRAV